MLLMIHDTRLAPGSDYHSDIVPAETIMTVVARHFALMTEGRVRKHDPSCITSFGIYTEILETWHHHPEVEEKIREFLWKATKRDLKNLEILLTHQT